MRILALLATGAVLITASSTAMAQQGVALSRFDPAERGSRFFMADSLELATSQGDRRGFAFAFGIASSYANRSRVIGSAKSESDQGSRLVLHSLWVHPGGSVLIAPGARFGIDVPIAAVLFGEDANLAGKYFLAPASPRLGDIRAAFDLKLTSLDVGTSGGSIMIAGGVRAWLPTGSADDYAGEDTARFGIHFASRVRFASLLASVRVGYMYRREVLFGGTPIGSELNTAIGVAYADEKWTIGPELIGSSSIDRFFKTTSTPVEILAGAHRNLFGSFRAGAGIGTSIVSGVGAPYFRALASIEWAPSASSVLATPPPLNGGDRDADGTFDSDDLCPDVPGPNSNRGCPPPPTDRDGDGIFDSDDACPDHVGPRTHDRSTHGCPPLDHDGDGIPDTDDACPDAVGPRTDAIETRGCPVEEPPRESP